MNFGLQRNIPDLEAQIAKLHKNIAEDIERMQAAFERKGAAGRMRVGILRRRITRARRRLRVLTSELARLRTRRTQWERYTAWIFGRAKTPF